MAEQRIKVSKRQLDLVKNAHDAVDAAKKELNAIFTTIVASTEIQAATSKSIDFEACELVVEIPDISPNVNQVAKDTVEVA